MKHNKTTNSSIKKFFHTISYIFIVAVIGVVLFAAVYAYSVMNNPNCIVLGLGESYALSPTQDDYIIRSYDAHVITPHTENKVIAISTGDAIVGIKYSYFHRDFYRFKVVDAPVSITLDNKAVKMGAGETLTLSPKCTNGSTDFPVTYSSTNEKVATVDENGNIKALSDGECDIYLKAYNGLSEKCTVSVLDSPQNIYLNHSQLTLGVTEKVTLNHTFDEDEYCSDIEYSSSDESVAVVLNGNEVTAVGVGKCTITAKTHFGVSASCDVTVKKLPQSINLVALSECDIDSDVRLFVDIPENCAAYKKEITISDEGVLKKDEEDEFLLHPVKKGTATVTVTLSNNVKDEINITIDDYKSHEISGFKALNQFPSLTTGCEVVSLTSVLNHYGFDVSMNTMAYDYMPIMEHNYYTVNPNDYFYGVPTSYDDGMGCYPGCIVKTAENYFDDIENDEYIAVDISGGDINDLFNYLKSDIPVITWVTSGFTYPDIDSQWYVADELITWYEREHCLVTTGYNENSSTVTVADVAGGYSYTVSLSKYKEVYETMGSMAVVILEK